MASSLQLRQQLQALDGQSYGAYQQLRGAYQFPEFELKCDRIQADPFAAPSQFRLVIPQAIAQIPGALYAQPSRAIALRDYLHRWFAQVLASRGDGNGRSPRGSRGSGKSGLMAIAPTSQAMLARSAVQLNDQTLELRLLVGLPAFGRRIAGRQAVEMLCEQLPKMVTQFLAWDLDAARRHAQQGEDAEALRSQLADHGLVAFVADGAILPRRSGVDERPSCDHPVAFQAPEALRVSLTCPHRGTVTGMGIPQGVTLIVGGGFHGKSTLLRAIEQGVYNHIPGDGREWVVTDARAMKVRAEDGRSVAGVDISPLINDLPQGKSTQAFSTANASGSTSQAANLIEALEAGARVILVDEDTSATNFMIRDRRMQALIAKTQEPITPFIDKIRQLYTQHGVSTILVMGGSGDYFEVADTVIAMQAYRPQAVTAQAKAIAAADPSQRQAEGGESFGQIARTRRLQHNQPTDTGRSQGQAQQRDPAAPFASNSGQAIGQAIGQDRGPAPRRGKVRGLQTIVLHHDEIDLSAVEQLIEPGQLRAIAAVLTQLQFDGSQPLTQQLETVMTQLAVEGFDWLSDLPEGDFSAFRQLELAAAINRWRSLGTKEP